MLRQLKAASEPIRKQPVLDPNPGYRLAIGGVGFAHPTVLLAVTLITGRQLQDSLSAYYHGQDPLRDWFVGTLWVIGVFLLFYRFNPRGADHPTSRYSWIRDGRADAWIGRIAGAAALVVAMCPTNPPQNVGIQPPIIGWLHGSSAAVLFLALSLFPLLLFSQSKNNGRVYSVCGWVMLGSLAAIALYAFAPESLREYYAPWKPVLLLETVLVYSFSISWFAKALEPKNDKRLASAPGPSGRGVATAAVV